ncbi:MAG: TrkH family potassium uptake protein [Pseudomonadales bacterium]|nr:TrkH family potassium uptake protein [Pseudomonadales bacterium]
MRLFAPMLLVVAVALQALAITMALVGFLSLHLATGNASDFFLSALICSGFGVGIFSFGWVSRTEHLFTRQMFLITTGTWLVVPVFASLPLIFTTTHLTFTDAVFETVSGLTTTGSTVLSHLESQPPDILLWRSLLQWQGGIGIVCMAVALLPFLKVGGMRLFQTESSYWSDENAPRAKHLVITILKIYVLLTALCTAGYALTGMSFFDAVNNAFTTISTGGYSTTDRSFGDTSYLTQWVAVVFMVAGSIPFVLYLQLFKARFREFFANTQLRTFLLLLGSFILLVSLDLYLSGHDGLMASVSKSAFNVTSLITTTGYASDDYALWGNFSVALIFFAMFIGGCSGSTAGGTKIFRLQLFGTLLKEQLRRAVHPNITIASTYEGKQVKAEVVTAMVAYFFVMIMSLIILTLGLSLTELDLISSLTGASTALMNVGPGLGDIIGPTGNFSSLTDGAKWLLCAGMILGRLEFLTILTLFTASFWRG